jgi:hypothetical protein
MRREAHPERAVAAAQTGAVADRPLDHRNGQRGSSRPL